MDLYLRKVIHPQAVENYRVILRDGGEEIEVGSIGVQHAAGARSFWKWGIDTVVPIPGLEAQGTGQDREACMRYFRAAWERLCSDPTRLADFLEMTRKRRS
jgi:hypothetical protein